MERYKMMLAKADERQIKVGLAILTLIALVLGAGAPTSSSGGG